MKWFDSLTRRKKQSPTQINPSETAFTQKNEQSHRLYRDIGDRETSLSLISRETQHFREKTSRVTVVGVLEHALQKIQETWLRMSLGKWCMILFLFFLSIIIYGL